MCLGPGCPGHLVRIRGAPNLRPLRDLVSRSPGRRAAPIYAAKAKFCIMAANLQRGCNSAFQAGMHATLRRIPYPSTANSHRAGTVWTHTNTLNPCAAPDIAPSDQALAIRLSGTGTGLLHEERQPLQPLHSSQSQ